MSQINPFSGSILQATDVQRAQAADKDRQIRRVHDLEKNAALQGDQLQHEVESSEAIRPVQDDLPRQHPRKRNRPHPHHEADAEDFDENHLDLTA